MLMEIMGLHLPGRAFVAPGSPLRDAPTRAAAQRAIALGPQGDSFTPVAEVISEKTLVSCIFGLLATGGSTNHTLHLVAIARARTEEHTSELQSLMRISYDVLCLK